MLAPPIDNPEADNDNYIERMSRISSNNDSNGDTGADADADDGASLPTNMKMKPSSSSFLDRDFLSFATHNANDNDEDDEDDHGMNNNDQVENQKNGNGATVATTTTTTSTSGAAAAVSESKKRGRSTSPMPPPPPNSNATSLNRNGHIDSIPWLALPPPIPPPPPPPPPPHPPKQQQQPRDNIPSRGYNSKNNNNYYSNQQQQQQHQTHQQYYNHYSPPLIRLHNEITSFVTLMSPTPQELELRDTMVTRITKLSHGIFGGKTKCQVLPFGSQVTGLCLPGSDIDFVIRFQSSSTTSSSSGGGGAGSVGGDDEDDADYMKQNPLHRFADAVQHEFGLRDSNDDNDDEDDDGSSVNMDNDDEDDPKEYLSYLEIIETARVPLVKFTVAPYNLDIDVCFDQPHGPESADLMHRFMESMPPTSIDRGTQILLASREINKPFTGGIGSYLLQLMIVSYLQHRAREDVARNWGASGRHYNLGSLLLEFLELYGVDYNYVTTGISVRHDGYYFAKGGQDVKSSFWQPTRPFSIAMENPLDPTSDVGAGAFKMQMIQRIFGHAFKTLLAYVSEPYERTDSILARIIPPTEEMERRMALKRRIMLDGLGGAGVRAEAVEDDEDSDMLTSSSSSNGRSSSKKKKSKNKRRKVERNGKA